MREIKFRIWDKDLNCMFTPEGEKPRLYLDLAGNIFCYDGKHRPISIPNLVLMQYTGLKDRLGKDIYEGDIIKQYIKSEWCLTYSIEWLSTDYHCGWYLMPSGNLELGIDRAKNLTVIGNLFESPELLTEVK